MHEQIETLIRQAEEKLAPAFKRLEAIEESGTRRVLKLTGKERSGAKVTVSL